MFEQAPISSLAIMCMKTVLENGHYFYEAKDRHSIGATIGFEW